MIADIANLISPANWPLAAACASFVLALMAEWLHARRVARVARLAFGPGGRAREWTWVVPLVRAGGLALLVWGLGTLFQIDPRVHKPKTLAARDARRILIALDVSPSMHLTDAGTGGTQTRAKRAAAVMMSVLDRVALEQAKVTVVAFYNGAKPVVVDAEDPNVVRNILSDLPLDYAFDLGKTNLFAGLTEAFNLAKPWREKSTTLFVVSDGDTVPESGMPVPPPSIGRVIVLGVGDSRVGKFIDGHQSRQDAATLRQVAARLHGVYHDGNEKHLPTQFIADLAHALPLREDTKPGKRELAIAAACVGAFLVSAVPVALALAGTGWKPGRRPDVGATLVSPSARRTSLKPLRARQVSPLQGQVVSPERLMEGSPHA